MVWILAMRAGLVFVGSGLIAMGIALILLGMWNFPFVSSIERTTQPFAFTISSPSYVILNLSIGDERGVREMEVDVASSAPVEGWLTSCPPSQNIPPPCIVEQKAPSTRGSFLLSEPKPPYFLLLDYEDSTPASITVTIHLTSQSTSGFALWEEITVFTGGGLFLTGGSLALFLGLFLRGGRAARHAPPAPRPGPGHPGGPRLH